MNILKNKWGFYLNEEFDKEYYQKLRRFLYKEYESKVVFPKKEEIYAALKLTDFDDVKVLILGQDPYYNKNQAHGLAFSVQKNVPIPRSLMNIYIELKNDLNIDPPSHGNLTKWAKQGVLLLNTSLSVIEGKPNSHKDIGWSILTDKIIQILSKEKKHIVYILWGQNAIKKESFIDEENNLIIKSAHPSPLSANRGFFGSKPFSETNKYLIEHNIKPIDWKID